MTRVYVKSTVQVFALVTSLFFLFFFCGPVPYDSFFWGGGVPGSGNSPQSLPVVRDGDNLAPTVPGRSTALGTPLCPTLVTVAYIHFAASS